MDVLPHLQQVTTVRVLIEGYSISVTRQQETSSTKVASKAGTLSQKCFDDEKWALPGKKKV